MEEVKAKLAADLDADTPEANKIRGRQTIARIRQIGGISPFGDSTRTTPKGSFEDQRQRELDGDYPQSDDGKQTNNPDVGRQKVTTGGKRRKRGGEQSKPNGKKPTPARSRNVKTPTSGAQNMIGDHDANNADDIDYYGEEAPQP